MPAEEIKSSISSQRLQQCERRLLQKDEKIVALETENAMLHLKVAQLLGNLRQSQRSKVIAESEERTNKLTNKSLASMAKYTQALQQELMNVRKQMQDLVAMVTEDTNFIYQQLATQGGQMYIREQHISVMENALTAAREELEDTRQRYHRERDRRKQLHNALMEVKGNIRVHCRVRPTMPFDVPLLTLGSNPDREGVSEVAVHVKDEEKVLVKSEKHDRSYQFERVYGPEEDQEVVFDEVQPMVTSLLDGYNVCIMAYGQTGSGKTHSMLGRYHQDGFNIPTPDVTAQVSKEGVVPRATREIFKLLSEYPEESYNIEVSVAEIYNNDLRDLLTPNLKVKHEITTAPDGSIVVPTLTTRCVGNVGEVLQLVQQGLDSRCESATLVHQHSSRSHLIVTLTLTLEVSVLRAAGLSPDSQSHMSAGSPSPLRSRSRSPSPVSPRMFSPHAAVAADGTIRTKLQLIDLAGSECVGMSGAVGCQLREAQHINRSLCSLADVLGALAEGRTHIPYRNSKLTHFLQDTIGGDAKVLVLLCVSPSLRYLSESVQSLGFGQRARQIQRGPIKRQTASPSSSSVTVPVIMRSPRLSRQHSTGALKGLMQ